MGDELRGESLVHLSVRFSTETELKQFQDLLYEKSGQGISFTGLLEAMASEVTIVTAVHNIKSNKGSKTAGVDRMKMDRYLQMPKEELFQLIQANFINYKPKPAKRKYIEKANGKKRPLGIPTVLDRIIQECMRLITGANMRSEILSAQLWVPPIPGAEARNPGYYQCYQCQEQSRKTNPCGR